MNAIGSSPGVLSRVRSSFPDLFVILPNPLSLLCSASDTPLPPVSSPCLSPLPFPCSSLSFFPSDEICLHVAYPPTCATLSGLSPTDKRALALKLSPIVIAGERPAYARKHLRPGLRDKLDIVTSSSRRMLAWCTGQRDAKGFLDSVSSGGTILPWIHCQGKGAGKCVSGVGKGEGAEEMMACARVSVGRLIRIRRLGFSLRGRPTDPVSFCCRLLPCFSV